ncbi:MAG: S8 family serine peptidase [Methylotetracoccus sp.]
MQSFHVMSTTSGNKDHSNLQAGLRDMNVEPIHRIATGRDVRIAIVDTGIDDHRGPRRSGDSSENFVPTSPNTADDIHGTAVAGVIAAAADNGQGIVGVAPGAKLIGLKACWQSGPGTADAVCNSFTLALALNTAITLKPDILNLSLVGPPDPLLKRLLERALADGMIVVASAPSDGPSKDAFPASVNGVIAVRSAASGTPAGKALAAPGNEILTTLPHGTYNFMSGSSFAAAHVSGLIALLLELDPKLTAPQISALLKNPGNATAVAGIDACGIVTTMRPGAGCAQIAERSSAHAAHARAPL